MANDDKEQWHLPAALRITNPKVAEEAAQMRLELARRINSPFARLTPEEFALARATARIEHLEQALLMVQAEERNTRGKESRRQLAEARAGLLARIAENLAVLGQYDLAAAVHPDPGHQAEYRKQIPHAPHKSK